MFSFMRTARWMRAQTLGVATSVVPVQESRWLRAIAAVWNIGAYRSSVGFPGLLAFLSLGQPEPGEAVDAASQPSAP